MTLSFTAKLAWRNIWRQKRRTLITASAIAVAMLLALFMRSMQEGAYAKNLDNSTRLLSGHLQLQNTGFSENKSIDHLISADDAFLERIKKINGLTHIVPRMESFALAAAGEKSKGVMVLGISPRQEDDYSHLSKRLKKGDFFKSDSDKSVIIGGRLAQYFNLEVGDEIILFGQGYHGITAAGAYPITGIIHYPNIQMDSRILYMPLKTAQDLYGTGNQLTAWVLHGDDFRKIHKLKEEAEHTMPDDIRVQTWDEISPELSQQITLDRVGGQFMVLVLYGVVGFGLFATIVMMTLERRREFAVMLATGMVRKKLQLLTVIESFFLSLIGVVAGFLVTFPTLLWFYFHPIRLTGDYATMMDEMGWEPIMPFALSPELFLIHVAIILMILLLCIIYPIVRIQFMPLADSLKG